MLASAGQGSGDTNPMESWLEAALELAAHFPPGQLSIGRPQQDRAVALMDDVQAELKDLGPAHRRVLRDVPASIRVHAVVGARPQRRWFEPPAWRRSVLDVGCSPGHLAMALVKAGFDVQGIDLNACVAREVRARMAGAAADHSHEHRAGPDALPKRVLRPGDLYRGPGTHRHNRSLRRFLEKSAAFFVPEAG